MKLKLIVLSVLKRMGFFSLIKYYTRQQIRILCYHGIWLGREGYEGDSMFMQQSTFAHRLECIKKWNFPVISLDQAAKEYKNGTLPACSVVITIDDGWYSIYSAMLPLLRKYNMPATLYCDTAHLITRQPVPHIMANYFNILSELGYLGGSCNNK
ncbi:MAG: polysaccharide deacetylase family protein, partial [Legionella sp.]